MVSKIDTISNILENGTKEDKIKIMGTLVNSSDPKTIQMIFSKLDDSDIEVRGEVFSTLVQNENKISKVLIKNLKSESKNIKGFGALILANRKDEESIPTIIELTKDSSSMVRACALGALGFLKAVKAKHEIHRCFEDENIEVKKSALKAAMDIGSKIPFEKIKHFTEDDGELRKLVTLAQSRN